MSATIKCDGCGKEEPMRFWPHWGKGWQKPDLWFQRQDEDGIQDACSRECIDKIAKASGKSGAVVPI